MRIAVAACDGRISPVFEAGKEVLLVDLDDGQEIRRASFTLDDDSSAHRVRCLVGEGVHVLICGGITTSLIEMFNAAGIGVVDRTYGPVDEALGYYRTGAGRTQ